MICRGQQLLKLHGNHVLHHGRDQTLSTDIYILYIYIYMYICMYVYMYIDPFLALLLPEYIRDSSCSS